MDRSDGTERTIVEAFYRDALGGREVWHARRGRFVKTSKFSIGRSIVDVPPDLGPNAAPIRVVVDDPDELAQRCWDAGFSVLVNEDATGGAPVSVIDPFGRRVDLVPCVSAATPAVAAASA